MRAALNVHVSRWRRHRHEVVLGSHDIAVPADQDTVLSSDLMTALRRLPVRQREVITLRLMLDLDTGTTANLLGIAHGSVRAHLHKAVTMLRSATPRHDGQEIRK